MDGDLVQESNLIFRIQHLPGVSSNHPMIFSQKAKENHPKSLEGITMLSRFQDARQASRKSVSTCNKNVTDVTVTVSLKTKLKGKTMPCLFGSPRSLTVI